MDATKSLGRTENLRIMREQRNLQQTGGDTQIGSTPSKATEKSTPPATKKRKRDDSPTGTSISHLPLSSHIASKSPGAPNTNATRNINHQGDPSGQASLNDDIDIALRNLASKQTELETMKDVMIYQRSEAKKRGIVMETLKIIVEDMKGTVRDVKDAAEAMQSRWCELEATIERLRLENATQKRELAQARLQEPPGLGAANIPKGHDNPQESTGEIFYTQLRPSPAQSASPVVSEDLEPHKEALVVSASSVGSGAQRDEKTVGLGEEEENEDLKQRLEQMTKLSEKLKEEIRIVKRELHESRRREELPERTLVDSVFGLGQYDSFVRPLLREQSPERNVDETDAPIPESGAPTPQADAPSSNVDASIPGLVTFIPEISPQAIDPQEARALEKVEQYKAHNVELKIARDVMRKKLLEVAAARAELETVLAQARTDLIQSQKTLSETQASYAAIKKTLFESDASLSRSRTALIKANQDLSKMQERVNQMGSYADSWKTTCISEREAGVQLMSQLTIASTAVKDSYHKTETPHMPADADITLRQQASLNVKNAIYNLLAVINAEINRRVGAAPKKDWMGLHTVRQVSATHTGITPPPASATAPPMIIQIPPSSSVTPQMNLT